MSTQSRTEISGAIWPNGTVLMVIGATICGVFICLAAEHYVGHDAMFIAACYCGGATFCHAGVRYMRHDPLMLLIGFAFLAAAITGSALLVNWTFALFVGPGSGGLFMFLFGLWLQHLGKKP